MFCFKRNFKVINENFDQIEKDLEYFKTELTNLKAQNFELQKELDSLKEKHQKTKKNLVKIVDTFTLKEYVLFKTRLLTKKQTETLLEKIYEHYQLPLTYRDPEQLQSFIDNPQSRPSEFNEDLAKKSMGILLQIHNFKKILNKLEEPALKDEDYFITKINWVIIPCNLSCQCLFNEGFISLFCKSFEANSKE
jgi:chromosome segregation ATPase